MKYFRKKDSIKTKRSPDSTSWVQCECVFVCSQPRVKPPSHQTEFGKSQNPSAVMILYPRVPEGFGLEGPEKPSRASPCHGALTGWFPAEPLPWEGRWCLLVCLDFCMEFISSSAKSFGEGGQIHRTLFSGLSESPVLTLQMKSSVSHYPRHPGSSPCSGTRIGSSVSWGFSECSGVVYFGKYFFFPLWGCEEIQKFHFFPKYCRVLQDLSLFFQFPFPPLSIFVWFPLFWWNLGLNCWFAFPLCQQLGWQGHWVSCQGKTQPFLHSCPFHYWASLAPYLKYLPNFLSCRKLTFR